MTLIQKEVTKVFLGEVQVRPTYKPRTFTISRTEQSNMSSGWTYSDDAAGLTAGDGAFDDFFGYSAVLLNTSGVETAEMKQSGGVFTGAMTTLGNITSGDNVMIKFPVRGIKMTKSGSTVTLSITDGLGRESEGYQYYAFNSNGTQKDNLYLGAYMGCQSGGYMRSWSGTSSLGNVSLNGWVGYANAYSSHRYHIETWYARQYINCLYMMKYGNSNSQNVIGAGYTNGSSPQTTGATNSVANATFATNTSNTGRIRLFGLEDRWGNVLDLLDGAYYSSSTNLKTSSTQDFSTSSRITTFDKNISVADGRPSSISGTNDGMFACIGTSGSSSTYYCDYFATYSGNILAAGGTYTYGRSYYTYAGIFNINYITDNQSSGGYGARLMYL